MRKKHVHRNRGSGQVGGGDNPCGYCHFHRATLTVRQLKNHQCLAKQCRRLTKYPEHRFWAAREVRKEKKRAQIYPEES